MFGASAFGQEEFGDIPGAGGHDWSHDDKYSNSQNEWQHKDNLSSDDNWSRDDNWQEKR